MCLPSILLIAGCFQDHKIICRELRVLHLSNFNERGPCQAGKDIHCCDNITHCTLQ